MKARLKHISTTALALTFIGLLLPGQGTATFVVQSNSLEVNSEEYGACSGSKSTNAFYFVNKGLGAKKIVHMTHREDAYFEYDLPAGFNAEEARSITQLEGTTRFLVGLTNGQLVLYDHGNPNSLDNDNGLLDYYRGFTLIPFSNFVCSWKNSISKFEVTTTLMMAGEIELNTVDSDGLVHTVGNFLYSNKRSE
jgi:hypothetical protein